MSSSLLVVVYVFVCTISGVFLILCVLSTDNFIYKIDSEKKQDLNVCD